MLATIKDISKDTGISKDTLYVWLNNWRFSKYQNAYKEFDICTEFFNDFEDYLKIKMSNLKTNAFDKLNKVRAWRKQLEL